MILKSICYVVYQLIGRYLPDNDGRITLGSTFIRRLLVKGFTGSKSHGLYINKNATISPTLVIGNNSGIGANSIIGRGTTIGDNVMMGPECYIYTRNHAFSRTDIPMREQGMQDFKPVTIGNDVWIGARVTILPGVKIGNGTTVRRNFLRQGFNCLTSITYKDQNIFRLELRNFAVGNKTPSASHEQRKNNLRANYVPH